MKQSPRPIAILIAALGGEGGGVLTNWIVNAAAELGLPVQSTSIPGVAQRTGGTTYYIEIFPVPWRELHECRPVLALAPGIGDVDVVLASELMEASRAVAGGFVTPERTLVIASTSRFFTMDEKIAMGDGRHDAQALAAAIGAHAQAALLFDMEALAKENGAMINAVMLGALAGSDRLPIPPLQFEAAIRQDRKAISSNLAGFRAGLAAAQAALAADGQPSATPAASATASAGKRPKPPVPTLEGVERELDATMPEEARATIREGVRRLAAYQDLRYARLYLDRLAAVRAAAADAGAEGTLLRETARHLAVRMSFEDVIYVAQAKIDPERIRRIAAAQKVKPGEPLKIYEFLKPGIEELSQLLPPRLARRLLDFAARRGFTDRFHLGMEINSLSISGYLRFFILAKLRRFRRRTSRYVEEQAQIESWLAQIVAGAALAPELAVEIAECARLIKGYGDTHKRGRKNFRMIEEHMIRPALEGRIEPGHAVDAIASARTAALVDPEGETLARCLDDIDRQSTLPLAAE
jgi:indolepyruvate ferredoxin oxidoreductase beta subunit